MIAALILPSDQYYNIQTWALYLERLCNLKVDLIPQRRMYKKT